MTLQTPRSNVSYLPHQEEGIRWMLAREHVDAPFFRGGILADDMGLGKTFQTIGLLKNSPIKKTLILCPPALVCGWTEELTACGFRVRSRLQGLPRFTDSTPTTSGDKDGDVWIMTYPQSIQFPYLTRQMAFQRVVLDEGHVIRNGEATRVWRSCCALSALSETRWILSATPIQNGTKDFTNICEFLGGTLPCIKSNKGGGSGTGCASSHPLRGHLESLVPPMLRRTMEDLRATATCELPIPPVPRFLTHSVIMKEESSEKRLFRTLCNQLTDSMDSRHVSTFLILERYLRLQQFIVHPQIYTEAMQRKYKSAYSAGDWKGDATKWEAFRSVLHASNEPTIVFCQFRREMDMVAQEALRGGDPAVVFRICGGEPAGENVLGAKEAVASGKRVIVIVQIVSGGCGLNLQFCSRILFLSKHWNPAVVHQAVGRAVRIGQHKVVEVHSFVIQDDELDNLDQRMIVAHLNKIGSAKTICPSLYSGWDTQDI